MSLYHLSPAFIQKYVGKQPKWGSIGYVTYKRTYARDLDKVYQRHADLGTAGGLVGNEEFWLTLVRVTEGTFGILRDHCLSLRLPWSDEIAQKKAQEMFTLMWDFKFSPPGRGLWMMGTPAVDKVGSTSLNNCSFISSKDIDVDFSRPFCTLMDFAMLGVGVGGDTRGAGKVRIQRPHHSSQTHVVADSREGWVDVLRTVLKAYVGEGLLPEFDYSQVRLAGAPIKGFGGTASGPGPLIELVASVRAILDARIDSPIESSDIVDVFNLTGRCVVAGNVRRAAELILGERNDTAFLELKDRDKHAAAIDSHRWASNNSILAEIGQSYTRVAKRTSKNGEPGYFWLKNAQDYGRMGDPPNFKDARAMGTNPCQPSWATVLTPDGIRTMADIVVGSAIWSGKRWTKVINKIATGVKQVKAYKTRAGIFYGTENHRVVQNGIKVEAKDVKTIDYNTGPLRCSSTDLNKQDVVNGLVFGDGTYHGASGRVFLCAGESEMEEYRNEFGDLIGVHRPGVNNKTYEVCSAFTYLALTFNREIPENYLRGSVREVAGFLRGLYTANGSVVDNRVTLKAASFSVIEDVQQMLSSLGISSYYTVNKPSLVQHKNGLFTSKQSYDLNIGTAPGRTLFAYMIGFVQKHKTEKLTRVIASVRPPLKPYKASYEVVGIQDISSEEVFDITVDADEHTYWTGGMLVSNCSEQTLEDLELCCLVETYPFHHANVKEFQRTIKFAYLYAKVVTLVPTHDQKTNAVTMKNRRIGCSMSGIVQAMSKFGRRGFLDLCDQSYEYVCALDKEYSGWLCVPESIKKTSVKPSGSISLLPQATPGIHHPISEYYWRVIRFATDSKMLPALRRAGHMCIEISPAKEPNTTAVYFPVKEEGFERAAKDVSMWEQLELAAALQARWADNQVSVTISFDKITEGPQIARALELYETRLKGVSFLPHNDHGYEHAPYQPITKEEYESAVASLGVLDLSVTSHETTDAFCDGDKCLLPTVTS